MGQLEQHGLYGLSRPGSAWPDLSLRPSIRPPVCPSFSRFAAPCFILFIHSFSRAPGQCVIPSRRLPLPPTSLDSQPCLFSCASNPIRPIKTIAFITIPVDTLIVQTPARAKQNTFLCKEHAERSDVAKKRKVPFFSSLSPYLYLVSLSLSAPLFSFWARAR